MPPKSTGETRIFRRSRILNVILDWTGAFGVKRHTSERTSGEHSLPPSIVSLKSLGRLPSIVASQSAHGILTPQKTRASPLIQAEEIPTPGLATSPPTPGTTLSQTPTTPIHHTYDSRLSDYETKPDARGASGGSLRPAKEFDPTSLFVGGLEMYGPGAWTDEKVRVLFGRFEGLEFVRLIRPREYNIGYYQDLSAHRLIS